MLRFKERLVARRNALNWSQEELAAKSGVAPRTIAGYESEGSNNPPTMRIVEKLAAVLGVTPTWLLGAEEPQFMKDSPEPPSEIIVADLLGAIEKLQEELHTVKRHAEKLRQPKPKHGTAVSRKPHGMPHIATDSTVEKMARNMLKKAFEQISSELSHGEKDKGDTEILKKAEAALIQDLKENFPDLLNPPTSRSK